MSVFRIIDKLFLVLFTFPPAYFVFRFFRWYLNTEPTECQNSKEATEEIKEEFESSN